MRLVSFLLGLVVCVVVQTAGLAAWAGFTLAFDAFLVLALLGALRSAPVPAMLYGALAGWMTDALAGTPLGLHGIADTLVTFVVAIAAQRLVLGRGLGLFLAAAAGAILQQAVLWPLAPAFATGTQAPGLGWVAIKVMATAIAVVWVAGIGRMMLRGWTARRRARSSRLHFR